jgi:hypothetical protein
MNYRPAVIIIALIFILSAGCISLGTQTTDILVGNETVGHIYLTPVTDNLLSNESVTEKFDMKVELYGFTFTKDGITKDEADNLLDIFSSGNTTNTSLLDLGFIPSIENISFDDADDFFNQIFAMPVTNQDTEAALDSIDINGAGEKIQASFERIEELLGII